MVVRIMLTALVAVGLSAVPAAAEPSDKCASGTGNEYVKVATGTQSGSGWQSASVCTRDNNAIPTNDFRGGAATVAVNTGGDAYIVADGDSDNDHDFCWVVTCIDLGGHVGASTKEGQEVFCGNGEYRYGQSTFCTG